MVIASGHSYERDQIDIWLQRSETDPKTGLIKYPLSVNLYQYLSISLSLSLSLYFFLSLYGYRLTFNTYIDYS